MLSIAFSSSGKVVGCSLYKAAYRRLARGQLIHDRGYRGYLTHRTPQKQQQQPAWLLYNQQHVRPIRHGSSSTSSSTSANKSMKSTNVVRDTEKIVRVSGKQDGASGGASSRSSSFWERFLGPKEMPERYTFAWYREMLLICTVFGITGSSTMLVVRTSKLRGFRFVWREKWCS